MVFIHLKSAVVGGDNNTNASANNNDGFLYETTTSTKVDDLINSLVEVHNARLCSCLVADAVKGLAMYGVMKQPSSCVGDDDEVTEHEEVVTEDPSGLRTGNPPDAQLAADMTREVQSLEEYIDKNQIQKKVALTLECIDTKINNIRDAVSKAYPSGLPEWEITKIALDYDNTEKLKEILGQSLLNADDASLWTCNKEFQRGKLVSDRLGSCNEKTKVIAKLTTNGEGPPTREPIVSQAERDAMAQFYFKRQEEMKRLALADEDDYLNSEWADPKGMKRSLQGLNDVKAPGFR